MQLELNLYGYSECRNDLLSQVKTLPIIYGKILKFTEPHTDVRIFEEGDARSYRWEVRPDESPDFTMHTVSSREEALHFCKSLELNVISVSSSDIARAYRLRQLAMSISEQS